MVARKCYVIVKTDNKVPVKYKPRPFPSFKLYSKGSIFEGSFHIDPEPTSCSDLFTLYWESSSLYNTEYTICIRAKTVHLGPSSLQSLFTLKRQV